MTRDELIGTVRELKVSATNVLTVYAQRKCPHVDPAFVQALENALGEISVDEALATLDRLELEHQVGGVR